MSTRLEREHRGPSLETYDDPGKKVACTSTLVDAKAQGKDAR
jgi:hypothetical protein